MIAAREMVSLVPASHTPQATLGQPLLGAAPSGCPSELCAALLHGQVDAGSAIGSPLRGRRGAGPDGSQPRPCQCLPSGTQNSLAWFRILSRAQPSGVQRPGPLGSVWITITAISGPEPPLGSAEPSAAVTAQLLPAAFPPRRRGSCGHSQHTCCLQISPQSPENATQDCGSD